MGYQHIENLYKNQKILMMKRVFAMEKVHGTSAHITYKHEKVNFFAGGSKHETFVKLFDKEGLEIQFEKLGQSPETSITVYGEAYGGSMQGMRETYGDALCFIAFEVKIGDTWLNVKNAEAVCLSLEIEFMPYVEIVCTLENLDRVKEAYSEVAYRRGFKDKMREGIVIRPLEEVTLNDGSRLVAKHKNDEFRETKTPRKVSEAELKVLAKAQEIASEWVTMERLNHILTSGEVEAKLENTGKIIALMQADILREASGEIEVGKDTEKKILKGIGTATALMFKAKLKEELKNGD